VNDVSAKRDEIPVTVVAFLVAALVPPIFFASGAAGGFRNFDPIAFIMWIAIFYSFSALVTVVFGVPAYLLGRHLDLIRWWSTVIVGFFVGVLFAVAQQWQAFEYFSSLSELVRWGVIWNLSMSACMGGLAGLTFWITWQLGYVRRRNKSD
jgi:hypothetical protein